MVEIAFKDILDAFSKSTLMKEAYDDCGVMHHEVEEMFKASLNCFNGECSISDVKEQDKEVNKMLVQIRKKILEYLAINSSPDLNASLELTAIANEYERIGDYCKDIAALKELYGFKCEPGCQICQTAEKLEELITQQFKIVHDAVKDEDEELTKKSDEINKEVKKLRKEINKKVRDDPEMDVKTAVVCATLAAYCRRISSHLQNVSSVVTNPFPEMGFRLGKYTDYSD